MGGEEDAVEVAVVGQQRQFDFDIRYIMVSVMQGPQLACKSDRSE